MLFNYRIAEDEVQIRIGSLVVRRIRLSDIDSAEVQSWSQVLRTWNEHWSNFSRGPFVVLYRKSGWIRTFVFNPPDPKGFVVDLRRRIGA